MKHKLIYILSLTLIIYSCNNSDKNRSAKGNRFYGGILRINETEQYQTLNPISITDIGSADIAYQIYEGLVKFNPKDLSIMPSIAEKWKIDEAGTTYTFYLRKGVKFHDNPCFSEGKGREVKASDFIYSFELLCTNTKENSNFFGTFQNRVLGADEFFKTSKTKPNATIEGIKVIDDYTLQIKLISPSNSFLYSLASPAASVVAKEAIQKYGIDSKIGTGPFIFDEKAPKDRVTLKRNSNYYRLDSFGNHLPYIDSIVFSFLPTKKRELDYFQNGDLSLLIGLPSESLKEMVESQIVDFKNKPPKFVLERSPEMASQYYEFNLSKEPFNNLKVRKAFSYAIDRNKIIESVLNGEAYGPGINGLCPPTFKGYDISKITGYDFDPQKARKLLAEAGYPDGKGFPKVKLELNSGGSKNTNVMLEIQKQIREVLNINFDFDVVSQSQKQEDEKYARTEMFRSAWVADFPSPENFLWVLYGGSVPSDINMPSYPNTTRYKNKEYDKLFEAGQASKTEEEAYDNFIKAEQLMMDDAPIMILWYDADYRLIKSNLHNFHSNPMRYLDFSEVFMKDVVQKKEKTDEKK